MGDTIEGWAVVRTVNDELHAEMLSDYLQAAGIEHTVLSHKDHVMSMDMKDFSEIQIMVPQDKLQEALQICTDVNLPEMELSEDTDVGKIDESEKDELDNGEEE